MKEIIYSSKAPDAIGPYSQAVKVGDLVFVSGQIPIDRTTGEFAGEDIKTQTKQVLTNVKYILEEVGYTMDDIVKTTVLLDDIHSFADMNEVYGSFFEKDYPARAAFEAANLPRGAKVEIEVIASK